MKVIEISSPSAKFDLQLAELMLHHVCAITTVGHGDIYDVLIEQVVGAGLIRLKGRRVTFPADAMADTYTVTNRPYEVAMVDISRIEVLT